MSGTTHDTKWRLAIVAAPVLGVAFFVWSAAQAPADVARSPAAPAILAVVAALGAGVAWWTARQLRAAPTVRVSRAGARARRAPAGACVALRGRARALPDAEPLVSPGGELCLWFAPADPPGAQGSLRPFLLEDASGLCVVLPAGAQVRGTGPVSAAAARSRRQAVGAGGQATAERLLRNGDRIHVAGHFVPASSQASRLQAEAAARVARSEGSQALLRGGEPPPGRRLDLPVIAAGPSGEPLVIRIGPDEAEGGVFGLLAVVDGLVLLVSSSLAAWGVLVHG